MFTRLMDFKRAFLASVRNKRSHRRHPLGDDFPLNASLALVGDAVTPGRTTPLECSGRVRDISYSGLSVALPTSAEVARKQLATVRLSLDHYSLEIPASVVHCRVLSTHAICGLKFKFADFKTQKAYHQLVEAVNIGASFSPARRGGRTSPGLIRRQWNSVDKTVLADWRPDASSAPERFELLLGQHRLEGAAAQATLLVQSRKKGAAPVSEAVVSEVRQLLRWVVPNLSKAIPADLRALLIRVAANNPPSLASATPPSRWQAPKPKPNPLALS